MSRRQLTLTFLPLALLGLALAGCGEDNDAAATRDGVQREAQEQLDLIDDRIAELEDQVRSSDVDERVKGELDSLKDQRGAVADKLREVRNSVRWEQIKGDVEAALSDLEDEVEALWADLKDLLNIDDDPTPNQGGDR